MAKTDNKNMPSKTTAPPAKTPAPPAPAKAPAPAPAGKPQKK